MPGTSHSGNCVYDIETNESHPFDPSFVITNKINWELESRQPIQGIVTVSWMIWLVMIRPRGSFWKKWPVMYCTGGTNFGRHSSSQVRQRLENRLSWI